MPIITETREFQIPPCKVDKELLGSLGEILESDRTCQEEKKRYTLVSRFRKIESDDIKDFIETDWPNDATEMMVTIGSKYPPLVSIQIDFRHQREGKVHISSSDATWANGILKRIEDAFAQKKLGYTTIIEDTFSKVCAALVTWFSLSLALTYLIVRGYGHSGTILDFGETAFGVFILGGLFGGIFAVYYFLTWLFPRYEFGETLQKRSRRWIWSALIGSGLIATIIDRLTNLL